MLVEGALACNLMALSITHCQCSQGETRQESCVSSGRIMRVIARQLARATRSEVIGQGTQIWRLRKRFQVLRH